jgi:NAD(P)-dependent dehydrogenase (short-subunit alcohol dehydrogenase family)
MPDPASTPKVAAVTGGMGGIGPGIVIALTQRDFDVVGGDQTIDPAIAERMTTNAAPRARLSFIRNDLADPGDLPRFADATFIAFGHIERLVNNAGLSAKSQGDLFDLSAESYDLNFAVNARGATPMTDAAQSRFDMLLVEGFTPSTAGAGPRMSGARSRPWPRTNFPSQPAPQFRAMAEISPNTEPRI